MSDNVPAALLSWAFVIVAPLALGLGAHGVWYLLRGVWWLMLVGWNVVPS